MDKSESHFTISDLAKALDVKKSHIRFCEENGLIAPRTSHLKRRVYNRYDRERLKLIFRFVLLGYSKEQMIGMIGMPDGNLDEKDQLTQGITYGEAKIEALETHKDGLSFTKQTRIINEIEMLREYIKNIRTIKAGVDEKPSKMSGIKFQEVTEKIKEPTRAMSEEAVKPKKHPIIVIFVFIAGLVLVLLIGGYFYYRTGKEETKTVIPVQKKAIPKEQIHINQTPEPANQSGKPPSAAPESPKSPESPSADQQSNLNPKSNESPPESDQTATSEPVTRETSGTSEAPPSVSPKVEAVPKMDVNKEAALEGLKENPAPAAAGEDTLPVAEPGPAKEKPDNFQQH
jgi:DNA-binding transcriptional MerR regulator